MDLSEADSIRSALWQHGFRPIPVLNATPGDPKSGKAPIGRDWPTVARADPPGCLAFPAVAHALNTGILCDGLRAIDIDVDDPGFAMQCKKLVLDQCGRALIRSRSTSPRCLILYRAAEGKPQKLSLVGSSHSSENSCKIEVLGTGQQFVAFGGHHSGAELQWNRSPTDIRLDQLTAVTEEQIHRLLTELASIIDAPPPVRVNGQHGPINGATVPLPQGAGLGLVSSSAYLQTIRSGTNWHDNVVRLVAHWIGRGWSDAEILATAASITMPGYTVAQTEADLATAARGGRTKWNKPNIETPVEDTEQPSDGKSDLKPVYFHTIQPNLNAADFIEDLLTEGAMSVVYGESNSGKTFFASDLALHLALERTWNGRQVEGGGVIYCALEGAHGISNRIAAFRIHHGLDDGLFVPFGVIPSSINLLDPGADTPRLIAMIRNEAQFMAMPVRLVVVDTLARALAGGNENAPDDMGALVINTDRIRQETGAHVMFVHHCGKDAARGARGHSSLVAATDTEIEVSDDAGQRLAHVTKQREMECVGEFSFTLQTVELGINRRGKPVTSCVVIPSAQDEGRKRRPRLSGHTKRAFDLLTNLLAETGQAGFKGVPDGTPSVPEEWWRDRFYSSAMAGAEPDSKRRAFRRAADSLVNMQVCAISETRVWVV